MQRLLSLMVFLGLFISMPCPGQRNPDSLRTELKKANNPKDQIVILMYLGNHHQYSSLDSAIHYYEKALDLSSEMVRDNNSEEDQKIYEHLEETAIRTLSFLNESNLNYEESRKYADLIFAMEEGKADTISLITAWLTYGNISQNEGNFREAIEPYSKALELARLGKDTLHIARSAQNLGNVHFYMGELDAAARFTQQALEAYAVKKDRLGRASCLLMMGNLMYDQEDLQKALDYYNEAYRGFDELNHFLGKYNAILNVGAVLMEEEKFEEAVVQLEIALKMAREFDDSQGVVRCLHNLGMSHSGLGDPQRALQYYQQALDIAREKNFKHLEANTLGNMAAVNIDLGRYNNAMTLASRSLELSREVQSLDDQMHAYKNLSLAQEGLGNLRQALEYHKLFKHFNDSLTRIENRREISEVEAKYQTERIKQEMELKNALLEKQDLELAQQSVSLSRQKIIRNFMIAGFISLFLILLLIFRDSRRSKRANALIIQQNKEIGEQHEEITLQKNIIEEKNQALISSIRYAQNIQNSLLPDCANLREVFEDYFIIYEPKQIVSGDFYWFSRQNGTTLLALADSTGHGVPGAFLSVLGMSFLNEFVARKKYLSPAQVLDEMRLYIISSLHQQGTNNTSQEGIEMALLAIDHQQRKITFSGARTPVYIAPGGAIIFNGLALPDENKSLVKIKGDPMPLSFHRKMKPFSNQTLTLNPGDRVYITTDGFGDQFGSEKRERFTNQRVMKLLGEISTRPMDEQKEILLKTLHEWKQDCEQIDDIAMIGFRL